MSSTLMTEPAAGWYRDPADTGAWRWWDGATWTDHIRPLDEAAETASTPVFVAPAVIQPVPTHPPFFAQPVPAAPEPVAYSAPVPVVTAPEPVVLVAPEPPVVTAPEPAPLPAPAAGPETVAPTVIPQPGQIVASPPVTGGSVPMTPTTPVGDQMYWHSAAAEVIAVPRLNHPNTGAIAVHRGKQVLPSYVRDWNDLGSPNTAGVWLLALAPILGLGVYGAVGTAMNSAGLAPIISVIASATAAVLLHWVFAALDTRALADRGYHAPRMAWMLLLPPLAYLIARGNAVRREGKAAWGPELVYILSWLAIIGTIVALSAFFLALYAPLIAVP